MIKNHHRKTDLYCPYCLVALTEVKATGHLFCDASLINCDYEVSINNRAPLTFQQCQGALKLRYTQQLKTAKKKIQRLHKEIASLNRKLNTIEQVEPC